MPIDSVTLRSTVKPFGALAILEAGGLAGVRPRAARARHPRQLAFRRGPPRPDAAGPVPANRRQPGVAGLRGRGDAARRADRRPPGPRWREAGSDPAHVLGPAHRLAAAVPAQGLGSDRLLEAGPSIADRLPGGGRQGVRHDAGSPADGDRRLRRRDVCLPASRGRPRLRDARRSLGRSRRRFPQRAGGAPHPDPGRDAREPRAGRRPPRPARHLADEGRARAGW